MILSYNAPQNKGDSSDGSIKEENYKEIAAIIKDKKKPEKVNKNTLFRKNNPNWEDINMNLSNTSQISKTDNRYSDAGSSLQGLSRGEDCIQKDVLKFMEEDSLKKDIQEQNNSDLFERKSSNEEEKIIDISKEISFTSQKSKNFILKSALINPKEQAQLDAQNEYAGKKKCINLTKPYYLEDKQNEEMESYLPFSTKAKTTKNFFNSPQQQQENDNNNQKYFKNEVEKIAKKVEHVSLGMMKPANKTNTHEYQQNLNKGGVMPFNTFDEQKIQIHKQGKSRYEMPSDNDLINNCIRYSKEQTGCRLLQRKIDEYPGMASDVFYPMIKGDIIDISCDAFGNYFIQKIITYLSNEKLEEFIQKQIPNSFRMMSFSPHGTRVIQKIFEKVLTNAKLLNYYSLLLKPNIKDFITDQNASHIIIQYVSLVPSPSNDFLIDFLKNNIFELSIQKHSCCALQKCIEYVNEDQKKILYEAVAKNSFKLFTDQYGNYVVQFVINACDFEVNHLMMVNFLYDFESFCVQKFSSNVIEKCLSCCSDETKQMIVKHMCNPSIVQHLLFDMYGNYVLQKGITIADEPYKTRLLEYVGSNMEKLTLISFGQKLYHRLLTSFPELVRYIKNDKGIGMGITQKKGKSTKNGGQNILPSSMMFQAPINSFQNFGNVYYQANPLYNPYQNSNTSINPMNQMNNFMNPQYFQQGVGHGVFMPLNYAPMNNSNYSNIGSQSHGYMNQNNNINNYYN